MEREGGSGGERGLGGGEISALQIPGLGLGFVLMSVCMCKGGRFWEWEDLGRNWGE